MFNAPRYSVTLENAIRIGNRELPDAGSEYKLQVQTSPTKAGYKPGDRFPLEGGKTGRPEFVVPLEVLRVVSTFFTTGPGGWGRRNKPSQTLIVRLAA